MKSPKEETKERYKTLCNLYGVKCGGWDMIHLNYSNYMFCPSNRKRLISEYLEWEEFVEDAKKYGVTYYFGIDTFLEEFKHAVYRCLTNLE